MNIFVELVHSVYDFKSYPGYLKNKGGKVFLYGLLLSTLFFLVSVAGDHGNCRFWRLYKYGQRGDSGF